MSTKKIKETETMDKYCVAMDEIAAKIDNAINGEVYVSYSAYENDEEDTPIDNLDNIALVGKVVAVCSSPSCLDPKSVEISKLMENPTWLDLTVVANQFIKLTGDYHIFFEGYKLVGELAGKISIIEFYMGS